MLGSHQRGTETTAKSPYVFLSYASDDISIVKRIERGLRERRVDVWIDYSELRPGDMISETIENRIKESAYFVICLSPNSVRSKWVKNETSIATLVQSSGRTRFLVPLLLAQCDIPEFLKAFHYIDFSDHAKLQDAIDRLANTLAQPNSALSNIDKNADLSFLDRFQKGLHEFSSSKGELDFERYFEQLPLKLSILATTYEMYEGPGAKMIIDLLLSYSHDPLQADGKLGDAQSFVAGMILGLFSRYRKRSPPSLSYITFLQRCIENEYIYERIRNLFLETLLTLPNILVVEEAIRSIVSKLFDPKKFSSFANFLLSSCFVQLETKAQHSIETIWNRSPPSGRFLIAYYIQKQLRRDDGRPIVIPNLEMIGSRLIKDMTSAKCIFAADLSASDPFLVKKAFTTLQSVVSKSVVMPDDFIEAIEIAVQFGVLGKNVTLLDLYQDLILNLAEAEKLFGREAWTKMCLDMIASRFVDEGTSFVTYIQLEKAKVDIEAFLMYPKFPDFLLAPKIMSVAAETKPFIVDWYVLSSINPHYFLPTFKFVELGGDLAKARLLRHLTQIPRRKRTAVDRLARRVLEDKISIVEFFEKTIPGLKEEIQKLGKSSDRQA